MSCLPRGAVLLTLSLRTRFRGLRQGQGGRSRRNDEVSVLCAIACAFVCFSLQQLLSSSTLTKTFTCTDVLRKSSSPRNLVAAAAAGTHTVYLFALLPQRQDCEEEVS